MLKSFVLLVLQSVLEDVRVSQSYELLLPIMLKVNPLWSFENLKHLIHPMQTSWCGFKYEKYYQLSHYHKHA